MDKAWNTVILLVWKACEKIWLGRITENIYSTADIPLRFGVAAKSTQDNRKVGPMTIVIFQQVGIREYIQNRDIDLGWSSQEHFAVCGHLAFFLC